MRGAGIRRWQWIHKWSSLVCTIFLFIICLTGLPLIFAAEINDLTRAPIIFEELPPETPHLSVDRLMETAKRMYPGQVVTSIFIDDDDPQAAVWMAPSFEERDANPKSRHFVRFDIRTGKVIGLSTPPEKLRASFLSIMLRLHRELFAGLPGELFLGVMGLLFMVAIVSGVVLYGPFTRKLDFGTVREKRARRTRWLDLHNLLGIVTLAWGLVVGATGVLNTMAVPLSALWQSTDVKAMIAPYAGRPPIEPDKMTSPQLALNAVKAALPGMNVTDIRFPGGAGGSPYHYVVITRGATPLTERLSSPVLVDARTGVLTKIVQMPWYLRAVEISRPLHFGDYGGLPLKVIWSLLDVVTILVLGSGLYLWLGKRKLGMSDTKNVDLKAESQVAVVVMQAAE